VSFAFGREFRTVQLVVFFVCFLLATFMRGDNPSAFNPPPAAAAKTYPAHESHDDEKVAIAIDPFDLPDKAKIFEINYQEKGFLPVRLIISNDGDRSLSLNDLKILFITVRREKLEPATADDVYRRIILKGNPPSKLPRTKNSASENAQEVMAELDAAQLLVVPMQPYSLRSGFLFFDIRGIEPPEAGAHIYITGVKATGKELFYFDIPLEKYLASQPGK